MAISGGEREWVFGGVLICVKDGFAWEMHIDADEAHVAESDRGATGLQAHHDPQADHDRLARAATAWLHP